MRLLFLDIETAPNLAYVWSIFKENIPLARLVESGYVLCFSAKWLGEERIYFNSVQGGLPAEVMLNDVHKLLDTADVVVHYNGTSFDIPTLNREFITHGFTPPSPYHQVDLLKVARNKFRFTSNKLEYIARELKIQQKVQHRGYGLWTGCMNDDPEAWKEMEEYNKGDVITLEELYKEFLPWIPNHPNRGLYSDNKEICPKCGGSHYEKRGTTTTRAGVYRSLHCLDCGSWFRGNENLASPAKKNLLIAHG